ncbi:MAG: hypothetical protein B0D96_11660, partial [Candidatus Sedimenticola endophacoides]
MGAAAEQSKLKGIHVLVVEDSPIQLTMLVRFLRKEGMTTDTATNGAEALALLEQRLPDIIISDVRMPEMDGFSLCANVKRDERLRGVPLILLTTLSEPEDLVRGLAAGADSYALKPYDEQECRYLVKDFGTSQSPKSTRQRDSRYCPDRPALITTPSRTLQQSCSCA